MPVKRDRALGDAAGAVEDAHDGIGGDGLARAGLADDGQRLALGDGDVDVLDGAHDAAARRELDGQIANVEQRDGLVMRRLRCAAAGRRCRAGRRPAD